MTIGLSSLYMTSNDRFLRHDLRQFCDWSVNSLIRTLLEVKHLGGFARNLRILTLKLGVVYLPLRKLTHIPKKNRHLPSADLA